MHFHAFQNGFQISDEELRRLYDTCLAPLRTPPTISDFQAICDILGALLRQPRQCRTVDGTQPADEAVHPEESIAVSGVTLRYSEVARLIGLPEHRKIVAISNDESGFGRQIHVVFDDKVCGIDLSQGR